MASISADTFTVVTSSGATGTGLPITLKDHGRKHRVRQFFLYPPSTFISAAMAVKFTEGGSAVGVSLPKNITLALWLAHEDWLKRNPNRSR